MERIDFMSAGIGKRRHLTEAGFVVMWSSGFIGARLGTPEAGTPTLMVWRFLLAAGLLLVGILLLRRRWPGLREIAVQGVVGLLAQGVYLTGVVGAVSSASLRAPRPSSRPSNPSWPRPSLAPFWAST
jgi:drug/metabolite transporter (DMT)-like permease